jgi:ribosome maturation factor RimP
MAEAKLVLTDALIAESLRRGKQAERQAAENLANDNQPASDSSAASSQHQNQFPRTSGESRHGAQHEGE